MSTICQLYRNKIGEKRIVKKFFLRLRETWDYFKTSFCSFDIHTHRDTAQEWKKQIFLKTHPIKIKFWTATKYMSKMPFTKKVYPKKMWILPNWEALEGPQNKASKSILAQEIMPGVICKRGAGLSMGTPGRMTGLISMMEKGLSGKRKEPLNNS